MPLNPQAGEFKLSPAAAAFTPGAPVPQESRGEWGVALCAPPGAQGATSTDGAAAAPATPQGAWGRKGPSVAEKLRQEKERREEEERKRELDGLMAREAEAATPPTPEAATPPGAPARLEPSVLSEDETVAHTETPKTASESGEEGGAHSGRSHAPAWHNAPPVAGGAAAAGGASGSVGSATSTGPELEMDFDDAIEHAGLHEDRSDRDRERSLSPRERFYGEDDGEVPVLLWAPSPYNDSPLYQGFGFSREELDDLRSPNTLRELAATNVARESWFSGCSAHSDDWSESASGTPASQGGQGAWADDEPRAHSRSRVSQASVRMSSVKRASGEAMSATAANEHFREFNCKVTVDDFDILHMIGEGGFGKVYQVRQRNRSDPTSTTGRIFAMKCMRKESVLQDNLKGTKNERSVLSKLRHPFIVTMHFAFQCKGRLYLIMDYFPGGQFLDMLHKNSPFSNEAVQVYAAEVMLALKELHANGIVHRDLKPENILVDAQGHLVVTDFGCSKVHESSDNTMAIRSNSWAGTELYMAPEQLSGKEYGQEVDWWALGVLVWEMVTGDHPFYHKNRKTIHHNILKKKLNLPSFHPKETHALVKGLLSRDASKRLGAISGAAEIEQHPFFTGLDFGALLRKEIAAPLRSHALTESELDVSAHSKRYTSAAACLSPVLSPQLSTSQHEAFVGFSFYGDGWGKPDLNSTPFRTSVDHMWQEEGLEPLKLPSPALGAAEAGAEMAAPMPVMTLPPVREMSGLNLSEMAKLVELENFSAAARTSMPCPEAPAGLISTPEGDETAESTQGGVVKGGKGAGEGGTEQEDKEAVLASPTSSEVGVGVQVQAEVNSVRRNSLPCSPPLSPSLRVLPVAALV